MYPSIEPYDSGHLDVGDGHAVYWEVVGSPDSLPAIWLHGGPGAPASPSSRRNFDPARYRAVIFDQRGLRAQPPPGQRRRRRPVGQHHRPPGR